MTTKNCDIKVFLQGEDLFSVEDSTSIFRYYAQYRMLSSIYLAVIKPLQLQQKRRTRSMMKMTLLRIGAMLQNKSAFSSNQLSHKHANLVFINEAKVMSSPQAYDVVLPLLLLAMAYCAIKFEEHHALPDFAGLFGETTTLTAASGMLVPGSANEANAAAHDSKLFLPFHGEHADVHAVAGTAMSAIGSIMSVSALSSNVINSAHDLAPIYDTNASAFSGSTLASDSTLSTTSSDNSTSSSTSNPVMPGGDYTTINHIDHSASSVATSPSYIDTAPINAALPVADSITSHTNDIVSPVTATISSSVDNILSSVNGLISNDTASVMHESPVVSTVLQPVSPIVSDVTQVVAPVVSDTNQFVAPVVSDVAQVAAPAVSDITQVIAPVVSDVTQVIAPLVPDTTQVTAPVAAEITQVIAPLVPDTTQVSTPVVSEVTQVIAPLVPDTTQVSTPVVSEVTQVIAPLVPDATQVTAPVISEATQITAPVVSEATQITAPVVPEATQVTAPVISEATQITAPVVSEAAQVIAPLVPDTTQVAAPVVSIVQPAVESVAVTNLVTPNSQPTQPLSVTSVLDSPSSTINHTATDVQNTAATVSHQLIAQTTDLSLDHLVIQHQTHILGH